MQSGSARGKGAGAVGTADRPSPGDTHAQATFLRGGGSCCGDGHCCRGQLGRAGVGRLIGTLVTVGAQGNEPVIRRAPDGTLFISALQHLYVSRDGDQRWAKAPGSVFSGQANLASDSWIDVDPGGRVYFAFNYLYAGTVAVCLSDDDARSFDCNPAVPPGGNDRQWITAPSRDAAYLTTNEALCDTTFFASSDRGQTFTRGPTQSPC